MSTDKCLEKLNYDPIPLELKEKLIAFALECHSKDIGLIVLANIVPVDQSNIDESKTDNAVFIYSLHPSLTAQIQKFYSKFLDSYPTLSQIPGRGSTIQIINGPLSREKTNTIHPHTDPATRPKTLMYIMSPGGTNVKTTWYKIKDSAAEYDETAKGRVTVYDLPAYDNDMLDPIEEHVLEEDKWYVFNHNITHGVTNIESTRIILTCALDYEGTIKHKSSPVVEQELQKLRSDWTSLDSLK